MLCERLKLVEFCQKCPHHQKFNTREKTITSLHNANDLKIPFYDYQIACTLYGIQVIQCYLTPDQNPTLTKGDIILPSHTSPPEGCPYVLEYIMKYQETINPDKNLLKNMLITIKSKV